MPNLDNLISVQDELIAALDSADAAQIEAATTRMAEALEILKIHGFDPAGAERLHVEHAYERNVEAAKRVNSLTNWTRSKLQHIQELRGRPQLGGSAAY